MDLITAILDASIRSDVVCVCRRNFAWYLKIDKYGSRKIYKKGGYHTEEYLSLEDYLAGDWKEYV